MSLSLAKLREQGEELRKGLEVETFSLDAFLFFSVDQVKDFPELVDMLKSVKSINDLRFLMRYNLFLFLTCLCHKAHMINQWSHDRCVDVQRDPNGRLDLWAREHYKSSIVTFGKSIQDICVTHGVKDSDINQELISKVYCWTLEPDNGLSVDEMLASLKRHDLREEITIGILSCTRTLAQSFLWEIKKELEQNVELQELYPEIFYKNPESLSDKWSVQAGINVKRKSVRKEATVEAWGLITGQPTGKHFGLCIYDDIITHDIVKTLYLSKVATDSWENSLSLGSQNGIRRYVGTRKHYSDTYSIIIERDAAILRRYTPYKNNDIGQGLALFSEDELNSRRKSMGETTFAAEYLQEPLKNSALGFNTNNIMLHNITDTSNLNLYLFCDPASSQKKGSDYTAMLLVGIDNDENILLIDGVRDRLNPTQRWEALYYLYRQHPTIKMIFYEQVGRDNDLFHFKQNMNRIGHVFDNIIIPLKPTAKKEDRIIRIEPLLEQRKFYIPDNLMKQAVTGESYDLVAALVKEELGRFPFPRHDDLLDCLAYATIALENNEINSPINQSGGTKSLLNLLEQNTRSIYG